VIFVDTSAWYAGYAIGDVNHEAAEALHLSSKELFVTTDYVIDETLTLFKARGNYEKAFALGHELFAEQLAKLIYVTSEDVNAAWQVFAAHRDKAWSFTDCVSYVVMKRLDVTEAFAFDEHFRQFGFALVRP
jgi:predicted nucleic acid-binding protein